MTIEEAIAVLTTEREDHHSLSTDIIGKAEKLGIEALKLWKAWRDAMPLGSPQLLPGETKD